MSEIADVLQAGLNSGRIRANDKRWITERLNKEHERKLQIALIDAFSKDPDLKWYLGVMGGAGIAFLGTLLPASSGSGSDAAGSAAEKSLGDRLMDSSSTFDENVNNTLRKVGLGSIADLAETFDNASTPGKTAMIGGAGFSGFCATILLIKAMFPEGNVADVLKAAADAVPF